MAARQRIEPREWPPDPSVERARARDRAWFEGHPGETAYVRASIPGEFDVRLTEHIYAMAYPNEIALVRVQQIAPGVRLRTRLPIERPS